MTSPETDDFIERRRIEFGRRADYVPLVAGTRIPPLTEREAEVFDLIVHQGLDNSEIAEVLGRSVRVAKFHVGNILRKLGATDRVKLVVTYWRSRAGSPSRTRIASRSKNRTGPTSRSTPAKKRNPRR